jgi:hypothetical protein
MRRSLLVFGNILVCAFPLATIPIACSDATTPAPAQIDSGPDVELEDIPPWEAPTLDADDPLGRVLVLPLYDPLKRCLYPVTEIGNYDEGPDGGIAPCGDIEVCYVRPDGILAYHNKDCVHPPNFKANWKREIYSDLGPCEPLKHLGDTVIMKDCPNMSCTYARDVVVDTTKGCATAIATKGCRDTFGKPTTCACDGMGNAFVAANPSGGTAPPAGFTACDSTNDACKKALAIVDTVKGCAIPTPMDAGTDASDAKTDAVTDASAD